MWHKKCHNWETWDLLCDCLGANLWKNRSRFFKNGILNGNSFSWQEDMFYFQKPFSYSSLLKWPHNNEVTQKIWRITFSKNSILTLFTPPASLACGRSCPPLLARAVAISNVSQSCRPSSRQLTIVEAWPRGYFSALCWASQTSGSTACWPVSAQLAPPIEIKQHCRR